jgi:hypothetical protein
VSRLHTSFVLGYHGCFQATGEDILAGLSALKQSENEYDWLGPGMYFWEADPVRAWEWARAKAARKGTGTPFVIGAAIDLGNCLDLMARESLELVRQAYDWLKDMHDKDPDLGPLPVNARAGEADGDRLLRRLDCATIQYLHSVLNDEKMPPFDTVRGLFTEGGPLYPGSGFAAKTHVQIAVRSPQNIKGFFRVKQPRTAVPRP